jgi:hypothetical protein
VLQSKKRLAMNFITDDSAFFITQLISYSILMYLQAYDVMLVIILFQGFILIFLNNKKYRQMFKEKYEDLF